MRIRSTAWTPLLALTVAGLLACGGGEPGGQTSAEGQAAGEMEEAGGAQQAGGEAGAVEVSLTPRKQSGIRGTATLRHAADTLDVRVRLRGLESGTGYPAHIHEGTCEGGGGVAAGLTSVSARDSTGTSRTRIPASKLGAEGSYFVQAHLPDGTPAACGNLPGMAGASGSSSSGGGSG